MPYYSTLLVLELQYSTINEFRLLYYCITNAILLEERGVFIINVGLLLNGIHLNAATESLGFKKNKTRDIYAVVVFVVLYRHTQIFCTKVLKMNLLRSITDLQMQQCRPLLVSSKFAIWCIRGSHKIRYYKVLKEIFHSFFLSVTHMVGSGNVIPPELCLCQERCQKDRLVYHYLFNAVESQ